MNIAGLIRRARQAAGLSQRDLAKRLGVHHSAIGQWELGQALPAVEHRIQLSIVLSIRFTDLLPEVGGRVVLVTDPDLVAIVKLFEPLSAEARAAWLRMIAAAMERDLPSLEQDARPNRRRAAKAD